MLSNNCILKNENEYTCSLSEKYSQGKLCAVMYKYLRFYSAQTSDLNGEILCFKIQVVLLNFV